MSEGAACIEKVPKYYPPDPTSCIFWLKNRRRDQWRDKVENEVTVRNIEPVVIETETKKIEMTMKEVE